MVPVPAPAPLLAHAFGARYDLPIPLALFVFGGAAVVLASFVLAERRAVALEGPAEVADTTPLRSAAPGWGALGVAFLAFLVWAGLTGSQEIAENILPTWFWLITWIVVPLSCGVLGDWTQPVNPMAALAGAADRPELRRLLLGSSERVGWPTWLGWWPAVVLFFLTACGELVYNITLTVPANTALALAGYAVFSAVMGLLFGPAWLERGELFTVLYATWGRLGWFRFGAPGRTGFAGGLDGVPFERSWSRISFVLLLLVSVNFDGMLATPRWAALERNLGYDASQARLETFRTVTFLVLALTVAVLFGAFALAAARAGRHGTGLRASLSGLLPSLLPIAFGYLLAHNLQYVLVNAQLLLPLIGNPTGSGSWPVTLPYPLNDSYEVHAHFLPSAFYWYLSVAVIVLVHVAAVMLAHRHLLQHGRDRVAARLSEYPWLVAMVGYTMLSLWLIAQPLVREKAA